MYIPTLISRDFCVQDFLAKRDALSTAESFKHWNTCMDNKVCKIVAIVGIALAALVILWLVTSILRCVCSEVSFLASLCCCCFCCRSNRSYYPAQTFQPAYQQGYYRSRGMDPSSEHLTANQNTNPNTAYPEFGWVGNETDYKPGNTGGHADQYYQQAAQHNRNDIEMNRYHGAQPQF